MMFTQTDFQKALMQQNSFERFLLTNKIGNKNPDTYDVVVEKMTITLVLIILVKEFLVPLGVATRWL